MPWYFYYGKIGFRFVEESILGEIRAFSYLPIYSTHVLSISLHGILESTDALEADTYDTRCNRGNTIKRICAPQPGAIEPRRNVPWNRPIVSIFIPHTRWSFTRYRYFLLSAIVSAIRVNCRTFTGLFQITVKKKTDAFQLAKRNSVILNRIICVALGIRGWTGELSCVIKCYLAEQYRIIRDITHRCVKNEISYHQILLSRNTVIY